MRPAPGLYVVRYSGAAPGMDSPTSGSERARAGWELGEDLMPESLLHDQIVELLKSVLVARGFVDTLVARNLAIRFDERAPTTGIDPDVCLVSPPPPLHDNGDLRSIRTWLAGHTVPALAFEVVSDTNAHKDYTLAPDKYAASGIGELVIFDPLLAGPASQGGPFRLQQWCRDEDGTFTRVYAGEGPVRSRTLGAYVVAVEDGTALRISDDEAGSRLWPTREESERTSTAAALADREAALADRDAERASKEAAVADREAERASKEAERAAKEDALARVAQLEALLAGRR